MSRRNYSKISEKKQNVDITEIFKCEQLTDEEVSELKSDEVITVDLEEETLIVNDDGQLAFKEVVDNTIIKGVVVKCEKLNVREEPDAESKILCVIEEGTEITLESITVVNGFIQVTTDSGIEGYCMYKFIEIK